MRYILCILGTVGAFAFAIYLGRTGMMVPSLSTFVITLLATVGGATTGYGVGVLCTHIDMELLKD